MVSSLVTTGLRRCRRGSFAPTSHGRLTHGAWLAAGLVLLVSVLASPAADGRQTADQRFLEGLRQRQLFQLAEKYCESKLAETRLPLDRRAELVIEYSRTLSEHALASPPGKRDVLWQQAAEVPRQFTRDYPGSRQLLLVETQIGLVLAAHGELLVQEAGITGNNQSQLAEARTQLRAAVRHLKQLQEAINGQLFGQNRTDTSAGDAFSADQLRALSKNVGFQLARALRHQGQSYPAGSPDRADSLAQATELLGPLAQQDTADALPWQSRLEEAVCLRLLENYPAAQRSLALLEQLNPPARTRLDVRAQRIKLALARRRLDEALKTAAQDRQIDGQSSAELDLAILEAYLAAWQQADKADDRPKASRWETAATDIVRTMEQAHGTYWTRRSEMLLANYLSSGTSAGNVDALARAADGLYRAGQIDEALAAYDRARKIAEAHQQSAVAFDLAYKAAAIPHSQKKHRQAADRYRQLALAQPAHSRAGDAHLLAVFNLGQLLRQNADSSLDEYRSWLQEHLRLWPSAASADQARSWFGRMLEREGDLRAAADMYRQIASTHPRFPQAVDAVARCYQAMLADREATDVQKSRLASEAVEYFERLIVGPDGQFPDRFDPARQSAALAAARIRLGHTSGAYDRAEALLSAAIERSPDAAHQWRSSATAMLVYALAAQPSRQRAAAAMLSRLSQGSPAQLLSLAEQLEALTATTGESARAGLAELQLSACQMLARHRDALQPSDRLRLDRTRAAALAAAGRDDDARLAYKHLAEQYSRDGRIQEEYATLLSSSRDSAAEAALRQWRIVEKHSRAGSPRWFRAKYHLALIHHRQGDSARAAKIIQLTKLLHPGLGGRESAGPFEALLAECQDE